MTYRKFTIDNTTCSRRFHLTYDDAQDPAPRVEIKCQFCNATLFAAENHPPVKMARQENLVKTSALSELVTSECHFEDKLSKKTIPPVLEKIAREQRQS